VAHPRTPGGGSADASEPKRYQGAQGEAECAGEQGIA